MARTDATAVRAVIEVSSSLDLTAFITAASLVVDRIDACATSRGITLGTTLLTEIETWLAAHLVSFRDQQYSEKQTDGASAKFQGQTGTGLDGSMWGQFAKQLDYSGCLAEIDKESKEGGKPSVGFTWLGKPPSEQTDYVDRD